MRRASKLYVEIGWMCYSVNRGSNPKTMANPTPHDHIVFTEFEGEEGILVDLNSKKYYQLNETAMMIWKGLEQGISFDEIVNQLVATYEINAPDALRNVEAAVGQLESYNLVAKSRESGAPR